MVSERPYRGTISSREVIQELERQSGSQFDPTIAGSARHLIEKGLLKLGMQTYSQYAAGADANEKG
jgi:HD-GYP domain-containing protein (c-di-GMP phosphodiesterase class II)